MVLDSRLLGYDHDLANRISAASVTVRRQVAATAATEVVTLMRVEDRQYVIDALTMLHANGFGDSAVRDAVETAADYEDGASVSTDDPRIGPQHSRVSHALHALAYALSANSEKAAHDAVFEAMATTNEIADHVEEKVRAILASE